MSCMSRRVIGLPALAKIANRRRAGTTSRKSSSRLPARSLCWSDRPVTLPPGRARLTTRPVLTGSPAPARTIGMTCFAARTLTLPLGNNDIDFLPDELDNDIGCALAVSLRPSNLDRDGPTVDPAEFTQPLHESGDPLVLNRALRWAREPNGRQLRRLLCARRERPRDRAANHRNELAALHVGRCPFLPGVTTQQPQGLLSHTQPATERTGKSLGQT